MTPADALQAWKDATANLARIVEVAGCQPADYPADAPSLDELACTVQDVRVVS